MQGREVLIYLALLYNGDWEKMITAIKEKKAFTQEEMEERLSKWKGEAITIVDSDYPDSLRHCYKPPLVLFLLGDKTLIQEEKKCVSIIGSREASAYGSKMTAEFASGLAKEGYVIVNGMAAGIDGIALKAARDGGGRGVGVLGSGIDYCFPSRNRDIYEWLKRCGLIISEYPGLTPPKPEHFPFRNRIVAALSASLIVGEAHSRSGTLITVGYAAGYTKEIGCPPFEAGKDSQCNQLIKDGACLLENMGDVNQLVGYENSQDKK